MKLKFLQVEANVNIKLNYFFSTPNQRRCGEEPIMEFEDECVEEEEQDASTQFLQIQKNQPNDY